MEPLVVQVAQGAIHGWQVLSDVFSHFPAGQFAMHDVPSKKVTPLQPVQVVALVEQAAQGAVHGWQVLSDV